MPHLNDPPLLLSSRIPSDCGEIGVGMQPHRWLAAEPIGDAEEGLDDEVREIVNNMDGDAAGLTVCLDIGTILFGSPDTLRLHHRDVDRAKATARRTQRPPNMA
jgi:hypothetical protein